MSRKQRIAVWIAVILVVGAGGYLVYRLIRGGPAGPVIVIEPEPEMLTAAAQDFTVWSVEKCKGSTLTKLRAIKDTYFGVPGSLSGSASKIVVQLKAGHAPYNYNLTNDSFRAITIDMELDQKTPPLTIARPMKNGAPDPNAAPTWNFGARKVPHNGQKQPYEWSGDLYGHITKLTITAEDGILDTIAITDLESIRIFYNPIKPCQ